ncbi:MAG: hypothetical protein U9N58_01210 [Thermodesulfobacteriota bacterium]|nr:hypothetical protein [Thermodesulfobacteriota bacterium]
MVLNIITDPPDPPGDSPYLLTPSTKTRIKITHGIPSIKQSKCLCPFLRIGHG